MSLQQARGFVEMIRENQAFRSIVERNGKEGELAELLRGKGLHFNQR